MAVYLCHEQPDLYEHGATRRRRRTGPGRARPLGVPPGRRRAGVRHRHARARRRRRHRHRHRDRRRRRVARPRDAAVVLAGDVVVHIDAEHRSRVAQLHTDSHVLNTIVYDRWPGTLVTGAQINADGTGRMDFDLSEVDNDALRGLDAAVNDVIGRGPDVRGRVRRRRRRGDRRRARAQPVGRPATDARRAAADHRDRRRRPPGVRRHAPHEPGPVGAVPDHQGRVQGQAQPAGPVRVDRRQRFGPLGRLPVMERGRASRR